MSDTNLEQSLRDLMAAHKLSSISIGLIDGESSGIFPNVYAQGDGLCGSSNGGGTLAEAVALAIADLNAKRCGPNRVELPALEVAA